MCHDVSRIRCELTQPCHCPVDRLDPVVDIEHLTLAEQLAPHRRGDRLLVVGTYVGEDGMTVLGWSSNVGDVPYPGEGHLEGAGYRRRGQGEDVDTHAQALDRVFRIDAESLLLVDHQQAEIPKTDILGEESMGPDDNVHLTGLEPGDH